MDYYSVKRLALVLATQAEIEGMKVENTIREQQDLSPAYDNSQFQYMAKTLEGIARRPKDEL